MRITVTIDCDDAPFGDTYEEASVEVNRIARRLIRELSGPNRVVLSVRDSFGKLVGYAKWVGKCRNEQAERDGEKC